MKTKKETNVKSIRALLLSVLLVTALICLPYFYMQASAEDTVIAEGLGDSQGNTHWKVTAKTDKTYLLTLDGEGCLETFYEDASEHTAPVNYKDSISEIIIGDKIGIISSEVFKNFNNVKELTIPIDYTYHSDVYLFSGCCNIEKITYSPGQGNDMPEVTLRSYWSNGYELKAEYASKDKLKEIVFLDGCKNIGNYAFDTSFFDTLALEKVTLPDSMKVIGQYAFRGQSHMTNFKLPSSINNIQPGAFTKAFLDDGDVTNLSDINWPANISSVSDECFNGCTGLTSLEIPENITVIGNRAFKDCTSIKELTLPIDYYYVSSSFPFSGCCNIEKITYSPGLSNIMPEVSFHSYWSNGYELKAEYASKDKLKEIVFLDGCKEIGNYAFDTSFFDTLALEKVTLPDSMEVIGQYAFRGQSHMTNFKLPSSINNIQTGAFTSAFLADGDVTSLSDINWPTNISSVSDECFNGCTGLTNLVIPDNFTVIGNNAFKDCTSIKELTIPIDYYYVSSSFPFSGCCNIEKITYSPGLSNIMPEVSSHSYWSNGYELRAEYVSKDALKEVVIIDGCKEIGNNAFYNDYFGNMNIQSLFIPESVKKIGENAFSGFNSLKELRVEGYAEIGNNAFSLKDPDVTIYAPIDSPIAEYAKANDLNFVELLTESIASCGDTLSDLRIFNKNYKWQNPDTIILSNENSKDTQEIKFTLVNKEDTEDTIDAVIKVSHVLSDKISNGNNQHGFHCKACDSWFDLGDCTGGTASCCTKATCDICKSQYGNYDSSNHEELVQNKSNGNDQHGTHCEACDVWFDLEDCTGGTASCCTKATCDICKSQYGKCDPTNHEALVKNQPYKDGMHGDYCSACDTWENLVDCGDADAHNEGSGLHSGTKATCCHKAHCNTCNTDYGEINPDNHEKELVILKAVPATCTASGKTEGSYYPCCNKVVKAQETTPALGHSYDEGVVTLLPDSEHEGVMTYTCTRCGDTQTKPLAKIEYSIKSKVDVSKLFAIKLKGDNKEDVKILKYKITGSNKKAASVNKKGIATLKKAGEIEITAYSDKKGKNSVATLKLLIKNTKLKNKKVTVKSLDETVDMMSLMEEIPSGQKVTFSMPSKMEKYASLDKTTGVITPKAKGKVTVTCIIGDEKYGTKLKLNVNIKVPKIKKKK